MPLIIQAEEGAIDFSRDTRQGIIAGKLLCHADTLHSALFDPVPLTDIILPEIPPRGARLRKEGGYNVQIALEGLVGLGGEEYNLQGTLGNDAVESHVDYQLLLDVYNGKEDPATGRAKWPKTISSDDSAGNWTLNGGSPLQANFTADLPVTFPGDSAGDGSRRNPMHGVEDYRAPGVIWVHKFTRATFPGGLLRGLGKIDIPPGNPPAIDGEPRNWLKIRVTATWRGNAWQIEQAWELSGPFGWVPEMYRYR